MCCVVAAPGESRPAPFGRGGLINPKNQMKILCCLLHREYRGFDGPLVFGYYLLSGLEYDLCAGRECPILKSLVYRATCHSTNHDRLKAILKGIHQAVA